MPDPLANSSLVMGGNSSKSGQDLHSPAGLDCVIGNNSSSTSGDESTGNRVHQGPVHSICSVGHDTILSGGVDKVFAAGTWLTSMLGSNCIFFCFA